MGCFEVVAASTDAPLPASACGVAKRRALGSVRKTKAVQQLTAPKLAQLSYSDRPVRPDDRCALPRRWCCRCLKTVR